MKQLADRINYVGNFDELASYGICCQNKDMNMTVTATVSEVKTKVKFKITFYSTDSKKLQLKNLCNAIWKLFK